MGEEFTVAATVDSAKPSARLQFPTAPIEGEVEVLVKGVVAGIATLSDGVAELTVDGLPAGTHNIIARYLGGPNHQSSEFGESIRITQLATTTSVSASTSDITAGESVTFQASINGLNSKFPTRGTVQFSVNGKYIGDPTAVDQGTAAWTVDDLKAGKHLVNPTFSGDDNYTGSESTSIELIVEPEGETDGGETDGGTDGNTGNGSKPNLDSDTSETTGLPSTGGAIGAGLACFTTLLALGAAMLMFRRLRATSSR